MRQRRLGPQIVNLIDPFEGVAYVGSLTFIVAASVVAALIPAVRAARVDPMATLRNE